MDKGGLRKKQRSMLRLSRLYVIWPHSSRGFFIPATSVSFSQTHRPSSPFASGWKSTQTWSPCKPPSASSIFPHCSKTHLLFLLLVASSEFSSGPLCVSAIVLGLPSWLAWRRLKVSLCISTAPGSWPSNERWELRILCPCLTWTHCFNSRDLVFKTKQKKEQDGIHSWPGSCWKGPRTDRSVQWIFSVLVSSAQLLGTDASTDMLLGRTQPARITGPKGNTATEHKPHTLPYCIRKNQQRQEGLADSSLEDVGPRWRPQFSILSPRGGKKSLLFSPLPQN